MEKWIKTQSFLFKKLICLIGCVKSQLPHGMWDLNFLTRDRTQWELRSHPQMINITSDCGIEDGWYTLPFLSYNLSSFSSVSLLLIFGISPSYQFFRESHFSFQTKFIPSAHFSQLCVCNHSLSPNCDDEFAWLLTQFESVIRAKRWDCYLSGSLFYS